MCCCAIDDIEEVIEVEEFDEVHSLNYLETIKEYNPLYLE